MVKYVLLSNKFLKYLNLSIIDKFLLSPIEDLNEFQNSRQR